MFCPGPESSPHFPRLSTPFASLQAEYQETAAASLNMTTPAMLARLTGAGLLVTLKGWLKAAIETEPRNAALTAVLLQVLLKLPVDVQALKATKVGTFVARLRRSAPGGPPAGLGGADITAAADAIYDKWAAAAKATSPASTAAAASATAAAPAAAAAATTAAPAGDGDRAAKRSRSAESGAAAATHLVPLASVAPAADEASAAALGKRKEREGSAGRDDVAVKKEKESSKDSELYLEGQGGG
jgi:hypothetical protein